MNISNNKLMNDYFGFNNNDNSKPSDKIKNDSKNNEDMSSTQKIHL